MLRQTLSLGILFLLATSLRADGISVSQSIDKAEVEFEGVVHLEIELTWQGPQSAYLFPKPLSPEFEGLKIQSFSTSVSSTGRGDSEITSKKLKYTLAPTASGLGTIHPVEISYITRPDSLPGQLFTEAMMVTIAEPKPADLSGENSAFSPVIIVAIFVLVAGGLVAGLLVIRGRKPQEPVKSPREKFLEDLAELKATSANDLKRFQTGLFRHMAAYLSAQYDLDLANLSPGEIDEALAQTDMASAQREKITAWLARAERERFSPATVAPGEGIRLEAEIREFFEKI